MNQSMMTLALRQIFNLVSVNGDLKSYIIEGPMGSGKSSIIKMAEEHFGDKYNYVTVDCTQWDVGDVAIPDIDKVNLVVQHLPNVLLVGTNNKPMFINLDELGKASRPVQNALLPVILERRVGMRKLPPGTIVCAATNLGAEGVGDLFQPHMRNRISFVEMRYPTNEEWINDFAIPAGVDAAMLAWAHENPQLFYSFKDVPRPEDNPYIFHPKEQRKSFCTPRSLYLASIELQEDRRNRINDRDATLAGIAGNIGARAAMDLMAFVELSDKMPRWERIISDPLTANVPNDSPAAIVLTAFRAVAKVEQSTLSTVMQYMRRCPPEIQCIFATQLMRVKSKSAWAARNAEFTSWVNENHWILA